MITIDAKRTHPGFILRLALSLAILEKKPITITNIRVENEKPGLTYEDFIYCKIFEQIAGTEVKGIEKGSTEMVFEPKTIRSAQQINFKFPALVTVMLPSLLLLYHQTTQKISLSGPTNYNDKISTDYFQNIVVELLHKVGIYAKLDITKRGYGDDTGKISLYTKEPTHVKYLELKEKGDLMHSFVLIHSYGHSEIINNYIIDGIKNALIQKNININEYKSEFVENREKRKGYGADAILIYENTILGTNVCSTTKQPSQLGKELGDKIASTISRDTPLDTHAGNIIIPFLAYHKQKCTIVYPKKDEYMDDCLYVCETILGTKYKKEEREKDILLELNP
ncbi:MAG: hypothetical protein COT14_03440 [Candidatus Diapherotrites archaeon CG08_land_8_20_14_0_20_30_16]|nr:MAG: hypothetical protein COT14_03440 [Candidatus Diapherotrites archaeon CG08_land_8_20_14_0_20_30_16]